MNISDSLSPQPPPQSTSASLRRSISTPTTLFSLKSLTSGDSVASHRLWKHNNNNTISLYRLISKITPEIFAKQLTLIDWDIFNKITRDELKPGQWTGSMKYVLSPNVVLFTRRFNIVTFWVIDEILNLKTPKQRAEIISFFIKLINNLIQLRNLHSSYAIKSALNSASIHRLEKTWNCLNKKDRQCFEKIDQLFSESDNSKELRNFMEMVKQSDNPDCIPNLATYLRDIIHIDSAYPQSESHLASYRHEKLESIYTFIERCQQSSYDEIEIVDEAYNYLVSLRYIEELQKFREDNSFKTSLKLEPDPPNPNPESKNKKLSYVRFSSHYDIRALQYNYSYQNQSSFELNKLANNINTPDHSDLLNKSFDEEFLRPKSLQPHLNPDFKKGHRKTSSLETSLFLSTINNQRIQTPPNRSLPRNVKVNLIDDSLIYDTNTYQVSHVYNRRDRKPTIEVFKKKLDNDILNGSLDYWQDYPKYERWTYTDKDIIYKGCVNRKTVLKDKKKPPFSFWTNYHIRLTNDSLLFFNNKSSQGKEAHQRPCKKFPLLEWAVFEDETYNKNGSQQCSNVFTLADHTCSTVYKIRTSTDLETKEWIRLIKEATNRLRQFYI